MTHRVRALAIGLAFLLAGVSVLAEVSVDGGGSHVNLIVLAQITDGADPIGSIWQPFRLGAIPRILNADGYSRGDGPPDLVALPDGRPVAVWAYNAGGDHEIAYSEWTGAGWSAIEFVTVGLEDELDPRLFIETDGTRRLVWWVDDVVDRVLVASREEGSSVWSTPVQVTGPSESGRRPSVAVVQDVLRVSYERDAVQSPGGQEAVVVREEPGGDFAFQLVAFTDRTESLDTLLHAEGGNLWLDWKQEASGFGCTKSESGTWDLPQTSPWPSQSWIGVEEARRLVRRQLFAP